MEIKTTLAFRRFSPTLFIQLKLSKTMKFQSSKMHSVYHIIFLSINGDRTFINVNVYLLQIFKKKQCIPIARVTGDHRGPPWLTC